jgi:hypothetical protein
VRLVAENYVNNLGIGGRFKISELYDLYNAMKLKTIEIISPDRDVQPDGRTIIVAAVSATKAAS